MSKLIIKNLTIVTILFRRILVVRDLVLKTFQRLGHVSETTETATFDERWMY